MELVRDFAGAERRFVLRYGDVLDLERACDGLGLGGIFLRLSRHEYGVAHIANVLIYALRGGGLEMVEARKLVHERIDAGGVVKLHALAIDVLLALMDGIEVEKTRGGGDPDVPLSAGEIFAAFAQMGIPPQDVRAMHYPDFVLISRAMSGGRVQPPTEDEYHAMIRRYEDTYGERL